MSLKTEVILIAGPSGSGKSTLANGLSTRLREEGHDNEILSLDNYYHDLAQLSIEKRQEYNFDRPEAWDSKRICSDVQTLRSGQPIETPIYDFSTHLRSTQTRCIYPSRYIILEGLFALCLHELNAMARHRIYLEIDDEIALERRIQRDTRTRGRTRESVIHQYQSMVQPANHRYITPSATSATIRAQGNVNLQLQLEQIMGFI